MGLKGIRNSIAALVSVVVIVLIYPSCDKSTINGTNCLDCAPSEPDTAQIYLRVTINTENQNVPIVVYLESFNPKNKNKIVLQDTAYEGSIYLLVPTNHFYSVEAKYKSGDKIVYAIDGGEFQTQQQGACDKVCWQVIGGSYDLRLK